MENLTTPVSSLQTRYGSTTSCLQTATVAPTTNARVSLKHNSSATTTRTTTNATRESNPDTIRSVSDRFRSPSFLQLSSAQRSHYQRMTFDTKPNSEVIQIAQRFEFILNVLNQICIGFVTIYMTWLCLHTGLTTTALHALLVTLGFCFLMAEAVMCHYNGNVIFHSYKRNTKTTIHWVMQVLGGGLGITGILIKCISKGFLLQTIHGKLGFSALILCLISMTSGLSALFSARVKKLIAPILNKTIHYVIGFVTFIIALTTQYYGYETGFFRRKVTTDFQIMIKVITLLSLVLTTIGPMKALYHKLRNIIKHFSQ